MSDTVEMLQELDADAATPQRGPTGDHSTPGLRPSAQDDNDRDRRLAGVLAGAFALVAVWMLRVWGWGVPEWQDLPSVRLDLALHGSEATLAIRAEATEAADVTNQVRIFHEPNEGMLLQDYPLSSTLTLDGLAVQPGLANTRSWDAIAESAMVSQHMVPQGIAVSERWVFLSAYDGARDANSVVYVLDRATGMLEKTVVLAGQPHAGGLAWDDDHERLWVCTRKSSQAQLVGIDLARLEAYDDDTAEPIHYDAKVVITGPKKASFVEYFEGSLYVGYFNAKENGALYRYLLDEAGELTKESAAAPAESWELPPKAQGVGLTESQVLVSLSHGKGDSELVIFERDTTYDHVASLPAHGARPVYGAAPAWPGGGEGSGSGAGFGSLGSLVTGVEPGAEPSGWGGLPFDLQLPDLEELFPFLFGGQEDADAADEREGSLGSAGAQTVHGHSAFAEGLARVVADRATFGGEFAARLASVVVERADSGEHNVIEPVSYAEDPLLTAELPPMMEDLTIRDGLLFAVHESGAATYRNRYGVGVDRVTFYPLSLFDDALASGATLLAHAADESASGGGE